MLYHKKNTNIIVIKIVKFDLAISFNYKYKNICSGVIIRKWGKLKVGQRAEATTFLMANSISIRRKISEATFSTTEIKDTFTAYWEHYRDKALFGRDNILASICPQVHLILLNITQ